MCRGVEKNGGGKRPKPRASRQASRGQCAEWAWCGVCRHPLPVGYILHFLGQRVGSCYRYLMFVCFAEVQGED